MKIAVVVSFWLSLVAPGLCAQTATLTLLPAQHGPNVSTGTTLLIADMVRSELAQIPTIRLQDVGDDTMPTTEFAVQLEVWSTSTEDQLTVLATVSDTTRRTIIDATSLRITPDRSTQEIRRWRDNLQVLIGQARDKRIADQAELLLQEGNVALAWEYFLRASMFDVPVGATVESTLRYRLAEFNLQQLPRRGPLPADSYTIVAEALITAVEPLPLEDILLRLESHRREILHEQVDNLASEVSRLLKDEDPDAAQAVLEDPKNLKLWRAAPDVLQELQNQIAGTRERLLLRQARGYTRGTDLTGAFHTLAQAAKTQPLSANVRQELIASEELHRSRLARDIQIETRSNFTQPRRRYQRYVLAGFTGHTIADQQQRYLLEGVQPSFMVALGDSQPTLPYLQVHRRGEISFTRVQTTTDAGDQELNVKSTRIDALLSTGLGGGTQRAEFVASPVAGISMLTGSRDTLTTTAVEETIGHRTYFQAGPTVGFQLEGIVLLPLQRLRMGLVYRRTYSLWITDWYLTTASQFGIQAGIVF